MWLIVIEEWEDVRVRTGNMSIPVKYSVLFMEWRESVKADVYLFAKVFAFKFVNLPHWSYLIQVSKSQSSARNTKNVNVPIAYASFQFSSYISSVEILNNIPFLFWVLLPSFYLLHMFSGV